MYKHQRNIFIITLILISSLFYPGKESFASVKDRLYGIDVLKLLDFEPLEWKRTAVFCNHSSLNNRNKHLLDILLSSDKLQIPLIYIFNAPDWKGLTLPEETIWMDSSQIRYQNYPCLTFKTLDLLSCDAILFDMQLKGTVDDPALSILQVAASLAQRHDLELIVSDRPPLSRADTCQGPWHKGFELPYQHGLTNGELALYFGTYFFPGLRLSVIPLQNIDRSHPDGIFGTYPIVTDTLLRYPEQGKYVTSLSLLQATNLYIEASRENLWFGSPSADPFFLKAKLADIHPAFGAIMIRTVQADTSVFQILSLDKVQLPEFYKTTACLRLLLILYPKQIILDTESLARKTGSHDYGDMLLQHKPLVHFDAYWEPEYRTFYERRDSLLLYPVLNTPDKKEE